MTSELGPETDAKVLRTSFNVVLHLALVALLVGWSFVIIQPFLIIFLWAIILAVALRGGYEKLVSILGGKRGLAGVVFSLLGVAFILVPAYMVGQSLVGSIGGMRAALEAGTLQAPPPPENIQNLPFVGQQVFDAWLLASDNLQEAMAQFEPQLRSAGGWLLGALRGVGGAVLRTVVALLIAAALLTYREPAIRGVRAVGGKIPGQWDEDFLSMAAATIDSVAKGVLGIAVIQAALCGIGLFVAGVPGAGLLTLAVMVLATIQVPALLVMWLPIVWAWSNMGTVGALVFTVWTVLATASDMPLKPLLLGRGVSVPSGVILMGAIGGMVAMGLLGLFVGAVVLGVSYASLRQWVQGSNSETAPEPDAVTAPAPSGG